MQEIRRLGAYVRNHLINIPGRSLEKKVVVFDSDDWGSLRMPSTKAHEALTERGLLSVDNQYNRFDSLETGEDLCALYEVLSEFRDANDKNPVFTANFVMGNPNFDKIKESAFEEYHHELFTDTYKRRNGTMASWAVLTEGIDSGLMKPQYHGREHLNVYRWMQQLQQSNWSFRMAFDYSVFSIDIVPKKGKRNNLMAALDFSDPIEREYGYQSLAEGILYFKKIFGVQPESFIAPCNVWDDGAESMLQRNDIKYIQSLRGQKIPLPDGYKTKILVSGHRSKYNQVYLVRNAYFEPATLTNYDWVGSCLEKIRAAFAWNRPAIISSHRINYIGSLSEKNRSANLVMLKQLLKKILMRWPDVEFMSSDELGRHY